MKRLLMSSNPNFAQISKKWYLNDLIDFCRQDPHIDTKYKKIDETLIECLDGYGEESLRNQIGHPIKLLVRDDDMNYKHDLERLAKLWPSGKKALGNFPNPKVPRNSQKFTGKSYPSAKGLEFG